MLITVGAASVAFTAQASAVNYKAACGVPAPGHAQCFALVRTDIVPHLQSRVGPHITPSGYGPSSLQSAYVLASAAASRGTGETVAVVDAYNDPTAASDLATYRSQYGLPACTTASGCFQILNENGAASPLPANSGDTGWATEESLDLDMVSAICPNCHIILMEATSTSVDDLGTAVDSAVSAGAQFVSNSYGTTGESSGETSWDTYYNHAGSVITASAGDEGYEYDSVQQTNYPAASQYVTAVGGTSLSTAANTRGWTESVWGTSSANTEGTGSGCSQYESKPSWQLSSDGCSKRENNDVSAVADPDTGVAVYDTYDQGGWLVVGGTSAASPIIASVYALAGLPVAGTYPSSYPYADPSALFDVTSGENGTCTPDILCTAETGYDGPTGLGTPDGLSAFANGLVTSTAVASAANPAPAGHVTLTAAVSNVSSGGSPTGTVTFTDGSTVIGSAPLSGGTATLAANGLAVGDHSITASYPGDSTHGGSAGALALAVAAPPTATIVTPASGQTFKLGQSAPTSFTCTEGTDGPGLSACDDSNGAHTVAGGTGSLNTSKAGSFTYAVFVASKDGGIGQATVSYTVSKAPTKLSASKATLTDLSATLKRSDTGAPVAGQTVVFKAGSKKLCSSKTNSSGKATCKPASALAYAALHLKYKASFAGNSNYGGSSKSGSAKSLGKKLVANSSVSGLSGLGLSAALKKIGHAGLVSEIKSLRHHHSHAPDSSLFAELF